jgi:aryl-alcohol dehydrogenase-like predicted oxidoreductase
MAQVSLAWLLGKKPVTAPIVGVSKMEQLTDALGALSVKLTDDDVKALEALYTPRANAGFQ